MREAIEKKLFVTDLKKNSNTELLYKNSRIENLHEYLGVLHGHSGIKTTLHNLMSYTSFYKNTLSLDNSLDFSISTATDKIKHIINNKRIVDLVVTNNPTHFYNMFNDVTLSSKRCISLDTETKNNKVISVQICVDGLYSYFFDVYIVGYVVLEEVLLHCLDISDTFILQNAKYDLRCIYDTFKNIKESDFINKTIIDTFILECMLTNGIANRDLGLNALVKKYIGIEIDKSLQNSFLNRRDAPFSDSEIEYACIDVLFLQRVATKQLLALQEIGQLKTYFEIEEKFLKVLTHMETIGIKVDYNKWLEWCTYTKKAVKEAKETLDEELFSYGEITDKYKQRYLQTNLFEDVIGTKDSIVNWNSSQQVLEVFKTLNIPILDSIDKKLISIYQYKYPIVKKFIDYKEQEKLASTYGENFIKYFDSNNRIHSNFWQILDTYRISSNKPNLQNLPTHDAIRNAFIPEDGYVFIDFDYSGQELRLATEGSKEPVWIEAYNNNEDIHSKTASMVFNIPIEEVRNKPDFLRGKSYRDAAKSINFGIIYGMSKFKLATQLDVTIEVADDIITKYLKGLPKLHKYLTSCGNYGIRNGYINSFRPYRAYRRLDGWYKDIEMNPDKKKEVEAFIRVCYNSPIQSTGALMVKIACINIHNFIVSNNIDARIVLTVHDQIIVECKEEISKQFYKVMHECMRVAGEIFIKSIPVVIDGKITNKWEK